MTTEVFPLDTKVLAAEVKKERKSEAGIILENTKTSETAAAKILAVGPDVTKVKVGNTVYLDWAKTKLVVIDGVQRVLLDQEDVMAVVVEG